jgi:hypothetical protein
MDISKQIWGSRPRVRANTTTKKRACGGLDTSFTYVGWWISLEVQSRF